jgi:hypothetical protein
MLTTPLHAPGLALIPASRCLILLRQEQILVPCDKGFCFDIDHVLDLERDLPVSRNVPPADDDVPARHSSSDRHKQSDPDVPEDPSPPGVFGAAGLLSDCLPMAVIVAGLPFEMGLQGFTPLT